MARSGGSFSLGRQSEQSMMKVRGLPSSSSFSPFSPRHAVSRSGTCTPTMR